MRAKLVDCRAKGRAMKRMLLPVTLVYAMGLTVYVGASLQSQAPAGKVFQSPGGTKLRVLVDESTLGGAEVEVAELTFQPNSDSNDHRHGATETFYVLEGELEQVINGKPVKLGPGMTASVRTTDTVRHKTGPAGAKVLAIWAPGGEIGRVTARWKAQ
jgi:quercetin dioxygenase-like cupin family protein